MSQCLITDTKCEFNNAACTASKAGDILNIDSYGPCITLNTTCDVALKSRCMHYINNFIDTTSTNKGRATITNSFCGSDKKTYSKFFLYIWISYVCIYESESNIQ